MDKRFYYKNISGLLLTLLILGGFCLPVSANDSDFRNWLQQVSQEFNQQGIRKDVIRYAFTGLRPNAEIIKLDRRQPEFNQSLAQYLKIRLTKERLKQANREIYKHRLKLATTKKKYGLPPAILVAIWAMESNFGRYTGDYYIVRSLATLAYDLRRRDFFKKELLAVLKIIQKYNIPREQFKGSWAGAMGEVQFMPSTFQNYAVDGNKDGTIDIWNNHHDIFHSAGNYLKEMGWRAGETWGQEVFVNLQMDLSKNGLDTERTVQQWLDLKVRLANGKVPKNFHNRKAWLLLPHGATGPAFLVYDNFKTLLRWNNSINYALSIGLFADIINRQYALEDLPLADWVRNFPNLKEVKRVQQSLNQLGYDSGVPDGIIGSQTRRAITEYQKKYRLIADGYPHPIFLKHLKKNSK